jgi:MoaA/NifB/PqqE/SkfB family radical SAM enzyme
VPFDRQLARVASPTKARVAEVSFLEFRNRAGLDRRRIPIEATIETTFRCNLNCVHCYVNEPAGSREEMERELSLERLKQLVDEIVAEGTLFVLFTGGEVLVRPDFPSSPSTGRTRSRSASTA